MSEHKNLWDEFLSAASKDETKKETNLILLGDSKLGCLSIADGILESLGQPPLKKRDIDVINYAYTTVGYPNRRHNNGDYLGVIHMHILSDESYINALVSSINRLPLSDTLILIVVDYKDTANVIDCTKKWFSFANTLITELYKDNSDSLIQLKESWSKRLLSIVNSPQPLISATNINRLSNVKQIEVLPRGMLDINLGVPFIVVCTNTEMMIQSKLFTENKLDFIQKSIRLCCLHYAASLVYLNTIKRGSLPLLIAHVISLLFPSQYSCPPPNFLSKDEVFIPVGCDNSFMIDDLVAGSNLADVTDYNAVIEKEPQQIKRNTIPLIPLPSEEEFFAALLGDNISEGRNGIIPTPRKTRKSVMISRNDSAIKPRMSDQISSPASPTGMLSPNSPSPSVANGEISTRNFFENLINGGGVSQTVVPRKSVNVRNLRRASDINAKL